MVIKAFREEIIVYQQAMYRFALFLLRDVHNAEDALQNVFIKLWNGREALSQVENKKAYCMKAVRNECFTRARKLVTERMHVTTEWKEHTANDVTGIPTDEDLTIHSISAMVNELPPKQKMVMHLRDVEGYEIREIAAVLDMEENAVRLNLLRARNKIKEQLTKTAYYEPGTNK